MKSENPFPRRFVGKPKRLAQVFPALNPPLYLVTAVTAQRFPWLACAEAHEAFLQYARRNAEQGRAIGGYVLMPDHLHFFVRLPPEARLSDFVRLLKQHMTRTVGVGDKTGGYAWQPGFFDHLLRSSESYSAKWEYVRQNPVRAGLAKEAGDWPYQGEVVRIER